MTTATLALEARKICPELSMAQGLAIAELSRTSLMSIEQIAEGSTYGLKASADVQIEVFHLDFKTQKPLHQTDCLICGALTAKAGA